MEQGTIEFFDAETKSWTTVADDGLKRRFFKDDNVDDILFEKGDRVSFTPESTRGGTKHYARKVKLIGVPDKPMNAKKAEIAEVIMKANDYLAMTQAFAPGNEDKKGYSATSFRKGVCLQQMWDDNHEAMPKSFIAHTAAALMKPHVNTQLSEPESNRAGLKLTWAMLGSFVYDIEHMSAAHARQLAERGCVLARDNAKPLLWREVPDKQTLAVLSLHRDRLYEIANRTSLQIQERGAIHQIRAEGAQRYELARFLVSNHHLLVLFPRSQIERVRSMSVLEPPRLAQPSIAVPGPDLTAVRNRPPLRKPDESPRSERAYERQLPKEREYTLPRVVAWLRQWFKR